MLKRTCWAAIDSANSQTLDQLVILTYLVHNGFEETAKSFYQSMGPLLQSRVGNLRIPAYLQGDLEGQFSKVRIRRNLSERILHGQIEEARALLMTHYPLILEAREDSFLIQFCLTAQSFIESVRQVAATSSQSPNTTEDLLQSLLVAGVELQRLAGKITTPMPYSLDDLYALVAYPNPFQSPLAHLFGDRYREQLASLIDQAILHAEGQDSQCSLVTLFQQSQVSLELLQQLGSPMVAFIDIKKEFGEAI